jgi:DNA-binding protein HU-beta
MAAKKPGAPATVTLKHLAANLSESHEMSKKQTEAVLGDLVGLVTKHLKKGDRIRIGGLGILQVRKRAARMGRNPASRSRSRRARKSPSAPPRNSRNRCNAPAVLAGPLSHDGGQGNGRRRVLALRAVGRRGERDPNEDACLQTLVPKRISSSVQNRSPFVIREGDVGYQPPGLELGRMRRMPGVVCDEP